MNRTIRSIIIAIAVAGIIYGSSTSSDRTAHAGARSKSTTAHAAGAPQSGAAAARDLH